MPGTGGSPHALGVEVVTGTANLEGDKASLTQLSRHIVLDPVVLLLAMHSREGLTQARKATTTGCQTLASFVEAGVHQWRSG